MDRRGFLKRGATAGAAGSLVPLTAMAGDAASKELPRRYQNGVSPWPICLDTATIRPASLREKVRIADEAGYDAIEPWDAELEEFEKAGGDLKALGREIKERGLTVPSMIGLWDAIPTNPDAFEESLRENRERMRRAAEIGAEHVQTIPAREGTFDLKLAADSYRRVLEIGLTEYGVSPALVFVEMFTIKGLGQAAAVALEANHSQAKIIPDVFHMYIAGSGFNGLRHLQGDFLAIFQFNDAPASPSVEVLEDEHRVFPGDGILPLHDILRDLEQTGFSGCISLELYNPVYWKRDLMEVAETGLRKTVAVIDEAVN